MLTNSMSTGELIAILFISACFLCALCYILMEEKEEADYYKTWEK